jgi:alkanesulfonate monooxygenase SsuD/methylene tetrahydromethanopterin reductase-like flavin-dependent oxidoreductase (luciferase family)
MGIGFYSMQSPYMRPRRPSFVYEEAAREAQLAEELGFDVFWMGEHHHAYDGYCPSLIPAGAFLAASTSSIMLAAGVLIVPHHSPERVAESSAAFQAVAPGRLRLAVGVGYWIDEFLASGVDMHSRGRLVEAALRRWTQGDLKERMGATQLWSGQNSAAGVKRAARWGLPLLIAGAGVEKYRELKGLYDDASEPGSDPPMVIFREVWVDHDPRRIEWIKGRLFEMWRNYAVNWVDEPRQLGGEPAEGTEGRHALHEAMAERVAKLFIAGSPEEVIDQLGPLVEAGVGGFAFRIRFDGVGGADIERCLELLAGEVVPQLQGMRK